MIRNGYNSNNLKETLKSMQKAGDKALLEFYALEKENKKLKEQMEKIRNEYEEKVNGREIRFDFKLLENKEIKRAEIIKSKSWSNDSYLAFVCKDGTRVIGYGQKAWCYDVKLEDMEKSEFFTQEEIGKEREQIEREAQAREEKRLKDKKRELERLKKELEG